MLRSFSSVLLSVALAVSVVVGLNHYTPSNSFTSLRQATVQIEGEYGTCSGVAIKPNIVLTAAHCEGLGTMSIKGIVATVVKKDPSNDLMLLYVVGLKNKYLPVAIDGPQVDEKVVMAGYPLGIGQVVTEGRVQDITRLAPPNYMLVTAQGIFGNSGGPVVVRRGMHYEVVGIVSAIAIAQVGFVPNVIPHLMIVVNTKTINKFLE